MPTAKLVRTADDDREVHFDLDGVFFDFPGAVMATFGVDCNSPDMRQVWPTISSDPDFWRTIPKLPDADILWEAIQGVGPRVLSGGCEPLMACGEAKRAAFVSNFGDVPVVVTEARLKWEFSRSGDVLVDDMEANVEAWERAGGVGILHRDARTTIRRLIDVFSTPRERRNPPASPSFWAIEDHDRERIAVAFAPEPDVYGRRPLVTSELVPIHGSFLRPPDRGFVEIEIVGTARDFHTGAPFLTAMLDGRLRDDFGLPHLIALVDTPSEADRMVAEALSALDDGDIANLRPSERLVVHGRWRRPAAPLRRHGIKPPSVVSEVAEAWVFPSGRDGFRTTKRKDGTETVIFTDASGEKHNEDGEPAIVSKRLHDGEIRFREWWEDGKRIDPGSSPSFRR